MRIDEAIAEVDRICVANTMDTGAKVRCLETVDRYVALEVMDAEIDDFTAYDVEDTSRVLLVPPPYDELYVHRLEAQIYYEQGEIKKYANSMALYNQAMNEYRAYYVRTHKPQTGRAVWF